MTKITILFAGVADKLFWFNAVVESYSWVRRWRTGGDLREMTWRKDDSYELLLNEFQVKELVNEEQWETLLEEDIICIEK